MQYIKFVYILRLGGEEDALLEYLMQYIMFVYILWLGEGAYIYYLNTNYST